MALCGVYDEDDDDEFAIFVIVIASYIICVSYALTKRSPYLSYR